MAKGRKTGGRNFKAGKSGNPNGRPRVPDDVAKAMELDRVKVGRRISYLLQCSEQFLELLVDNPEAPYIDKLLARIILKSFPGGDHRRLEFLFNRSIGKVPLPLSDADGKPLGTTYVDFIRLAIGLQKGEVPDQKKEAA